MNGFRLFRLPTPSKESVVGILGPNGMGKSTAINALVGPHGPESRGLVGQGSGLGRRHRNTCRVANFRDFFSSAVREGENQGGSQTTECRPPYRSESKAPFGILLSRVDERKRHVRRNDQRTGQSTTCSTELIQQLSGGELQRTAICATLLARRRRVLLR